MTIRHTLFQARNVASVFAKDWARYRRALNEGGGAYLSLCNRNETLEPAPAGLGYRCNWQWTSDLHAPKFVPLLGTQLLERALRDYPVRRAAAPAGASQAAELSFVIGHRGMERLPHLLATLESIAAQRGTDVDCVVVEQDADPLIAPHLPAWVRHIHTPPPGPTMPYCRSWAFNVAARHCDARVLVLHDNDMLVPADYAAAILRRVNQGAEIVNLKRFIFYLRQDHTQRVLAGEASLTDQAPDAIVQNLEAGGSIAITRDAFDRIGGMDESFVGWGGEDNEFWERAQTLRVWPYGAMPIVHLWHPAQPGKHQPGNARVKQYEALSSQPATARICRLRALARGRPEGPADYVSHGEV
jgi:hypothetical protein